MDKILPNIKRTAPEKKLFDLLKWTNELKSISKERVHNLTNILIIFTENYRKK